jgi:hydrogenase-4 component B
MTAGAFWALGAIYLLGVACALVLPKRLWLSLACAASASGLAAVVGIVAILDHSTFSAQLDTGLPFGPLTFGLDPISGLFLAIIGVIGAAAGVFTARYLRAELPRWSPRGAFSILNLLLLSLVWIVTSRDGFSFLMAWEAMAFLSFLAVSLELENARAARAGYVMLAYSEFGAIGIMAAILFLGHEGGGMSFDALRNGATTLEPWIRDLVFLLALFGFGAKAGLLPLQGWLPDANAEAPSHIAAILSAAIEGLGIYGIIRFIVDILGPGPMWWGLFMLGLGALTAFIGILHALVQRDLKRVLAYSTVENDGLIVAALGLSLAYRSDGLDVLAAIAGIFALYHLVNHAIYKGLLFLGAGAVQSQTGTTDLELLGGLVRLMPWTAALFLIGALSIAAVAPFAGYISEWGILESMLQSFAMSSTPAKLVVAASGALVAFTAALAITTFVRLYAVGFLAQPRAEQTSRAGEVVPTMRIPMLALAVVTVALGALPAFVITALDRVSTPLWGVSVLNRVVPPLFTDHPGPYAPLVGLGGGLFRALPVNGLVIIAAPDFTTINSPTYLILAELVLLGALFGARRLIRPLGARRTGPVWAGGIPRFVPRMQYGGVAYSNPARLIFNAFYRSRATLTSVSPAARHGEGRIEYEQEVPAPLERILYRPLSRATEFVAARVKILQSGSVNQYVLYIFIMVLIILVLRAV